MTYFCPVCGYPDLDEPPYLENEIPSYNICPCCGVEFGFADGGRQGEALQYWILKTRNTWIRQGMCWRSSSESPPANWDPSSQLENLRQDKGPVAGPGRYEYHRLENEGQEP
ncbi:rubredoxin [Arthrobacter bambusae]|uniref:Rubredoxin n=1 Tax=Arthrobacter bambusae TaxID=1338426 RepID=A0AAW8D8M1_9MICC|nr:rubredoxin [Arthrobacter bambusae]MDQ0129428.1 rubredoxin [Arthrobacter bambusae]MDQ0180959.1 rubredoxin [Arthrobacter bambusae]